MGKNIPSFRHYLKKLKKKKLRYLLPLVTFIILVLGLAYYFFAYPEPFSSRIEHGQNTSQGTGSLSGQSDQSLSATQNGISTDDSSSSGDSVSSNNNPTPTPDNNGGPASTPTPTVAPTPTPTPAPEWPTTAVAFYADSQSDSDADDVVHQQVVNYILSSDAGTVFHAGDLLENGTVDSLNRFNNVTATLRANLGFYSAPGNNEENSSVYFDNFSYPGNEHWFSVNIGGLHMVILDNYASSVTVGSEQYNWLAADLQSAESQGRITGVIFHYPIYGAGDLASLFVNYGVDFVVSGHVHTYQKLLVNGVYYFTLSGQTSIGYLVAYIYNGSAEIYAYDSGNNLIDSTSFDAR